MFLTSKQTWLKKSQISRRAGDVFAEENYLSWRTLVTIADMKHQFMELLADIGFVFVGTKRRSSGEDCVLQMSGSEVHVFILNWLSIVIRQFNTKFNLL